MSQHTTLTMASIATDLEAFCPTCPDAEEVRAVLASLDFRLVFSMPALHSQDTLPPLPAQYHYCDQQGNEVIYLAGRDSPLHTGELSLPFHESRFWLSRGGGDTSIFQRVCSRLAIRWHFQWQGTSRHNGEDAREVA